MSTVTLTSNQLALIVTLRDESVMKYFKEKFPEIYDNPSKREFTEDELTNLLVTIPLDKLKDNLNFFNNEKINEIYNDFKKIEKMTQECEACLNEEPGQLAHMDYGGCLFTMDD